MPTATFTADFTKWNEALRNAQSSLKPLEVSAKGVQAQFAKMAQSFSGVQIQKQAQLAAAAVQAIGGVTKLTANEQARLNAQVTEAIAKYRALGQTAPQELQDIVDATSKAAKSTTENVTSFKSLVASYATGLATFEVAKRALEGIGEFLSSSVDSYAEAEKGQKRLTVALQNTGHATPEVIKQYDDLAHEFQRTTTFSNNLITSTEALFTQIGNVGPQDMKAALSATTDLAEGLGVDLEQAATAVAKATEGQTTALHKLAPSLDEAAIKGGDLASIAAEIERHFGGQAAASLDTYSGHVKQLANDWDSVKEAIGGAIANDPVILTGFRKISQAVDQTSQSTEGFKQGIFGLLSNLDGVNSGLSDVGTTALIVSHAIDLLDENTGQLTATFDKLKAQADVQFLPKGLEDKSAGGLAVFEQLVKDADAAKKAADLAAKAAAEAAKALKALREEITGDRLVKDLTDLQKAWDGLTPAEKAQAIQLGIVTDRFIDLASKLPKLPPNLRAFAVTMNEAALSTGKMTLQVGQLKPLIETLGTSVDRTGKQFRDWGFDVGFEATIPIINLGKALKETDGFIGQLPDSIEKDKKATKDWKQSLDELAQSFAELAQISGGTLGGILGFLGKVTASANIAVKSFDNIGSGLDALKNAGGIKDMIGGFAQLTTGILGAVSAALALGKAIKDLFRDRAEQLQRSVQQDFGVSITKDLGQQIENRAKNEFGGSRQAAQVGSLSDIISAGGGVTTQNLDKLQARLHDVFSLLQTGELNASQSQKILNDNFQTFVDFLGGRVNPALKQIIKLNDEFGTQSKAIAQYVDAQANSALTALTKVITARGTLVDQLSKAKPGSDEAKKLQSQLDATPLTKGGAQAEGAALFGIFERLTKDGASAIDVLKQLDPVIESLDKQLAKAGLSGGAAFDQIKSLAGVATDEIAGPAFDAIQAFGQALDGLNNAGILNQEEFAGLSEQITATYNAAVDALTKQGKDGSAALGLVAPQLQEIWELQQDFGYAVDESTQKLLDQAVAAGDVGEKHRSVQAQTLDVMKHLDEVITGIGEKFGVYLPQKAEEGATGINDAFGGVVEPQIFDDMSYRMKAGFPEDANTGVGGINEAWTKISTPEELQQLQETLRNKLADAAQDGVGGINNALKKIVVPDIKVPDLHVKVRYDIPEGYPTGPSGAPVPYSKGGPVYAAAGFFAPKGTDTVPAMLTPGELVVSRNDVSMAGGAGAALSRVRGGSAAVSIPTQAVVILQIDNRELARAVADVLPGEVRRLGVRVRT